MKKAKLITMITLALVAIAGGSALDYSGVITNEAFGLVEAACVLGIIAIACIPGPAEGNVREAQPRNWNHPVSRFRENRQDEPMAA